MDTGRSEAVLRLFTPTGPQEYQDFFWVNDRTLSSSTAMPLGPYSGPIYVVYMGGNLRAAKRFLLLERTRCDRVELL